MPTNAKAPLSAMPTETADQPPAIEPSTVRGAISEKEAISEKGASSAATAPGADKDGSAMTAWLDDGNLRPARDLSDDGDLRPAQDLSDADGCDTEGHSFFEYTLPPATGDAWRAFTNAVDRLEMSNDAAIAMAIVSHGQSLRDDHVIPLEACCRIGGVTEDAMRGYLRELNQALRVAKAGSCSVFTDTDNRAVVSLRLTPHPDNDTPGGEGCSSGITPLRGNGYVNGKRSSPDSRLLSREPPIKVSEPASAREPLKNVGEPASAKEPLNNVGEPASAREKSAKKPSLHSVNAQFESIFNTAVATQSVDQSTPGRAPVKSDKGVA